MKHRNMLIVVSYDYLGVLCYSRKCDNSEICINKSYSGITDTNTSVTIIL